ncbi:MAG TPA: hypothetical protein VFA39_18995 [Steroidobacteraceae bacterium]|nr:hypothetical protein [Steroidobacteraceae bacterium]
MANRTIHTSHISAGAHPRFPVKAGGFAPTAALRPGHAGSFDAAMAAQRARVPRLAALHPRAIVGTLRQR